MAYVTYIAKLEIEPTGFSKTGTDFSAIASDDSIDAATTNISGLLTDQWLQAAGFAKNSAPAPLGGWFQVKSNSTSAKILTLTPPIDHLRLSGVSGNYASTPDSAANSITGDIDIRAKVALIDWSPIAATSLISKWIASGNQRSYFFRIEVDGKLSIFWSPDGTTVKSSTSTIAIAVADGATKWVRVTLDVDNGAAGNDAKFYTSDDGVAFTQLGATVTTAGTTSIFNSTSGLEIGSTDAGTLVLNGGRWYYAEVRNGIGGSVAAAFDASRGARNGATIVALTGETWTINTSGTPPSMLQGPRLFDEGAEYFLSNADSDASTPDSAAISVTGDIDLRAKAALADWSPATSNYFIAKDDAGSNRDYWLRTEASSTGKLVFGYSNDGTTIREATSTVAAPFVDGATGWARATYATGSGTVQFFTSSDGQAWTQLGANVVLTAGTIHNGTGILTIAGRGDATQLLNGKLYYAEVRSGIAGSVVASFDPGRAPAGAASFVAYTGEMWTVSANPGAGLIRTTPVTITGYKRGFGQSYNLEFKAEAVDRSKKVKRSVQQPIGGGAPEVQRYRNEVYVDVLTEILDEATQLPQFLEFLASVEAGEVFTFDRYGTIASPVDPRQAMLSSEGYEERRSMTSLRQRIPFQVRLLS